MFIPVFQLLLAEVFLPPHISCLFFVPLGLVTESPWQTLNKLCLKNIKKLAVKSMLWTSLCSCTCIHTTLTCLYPSSGGAFLSRSGGMKPGHRTGSGKFAISRPTTSGYHPSGHRGYPGHWHQHWRHRIEEQVTRENLWKRRRCRPSPRKGKMGRTSR